jgi:hypothetical protein
MRMSTFISFTTAIWNFFHSEKNSAIYCCKHTEVCLPADLYFPPDLKLTSVLSTYLNKVPKMKFHENPYSRSQAVPSWGTDGWRGRDDEANDCY